MKKQCGIAKKVYNPLNKLVRRIRDVIKSLAFQGSVALLLFPIGFGLVAAGIVLDSSSPAKCPLMLAGSIGILGGVAYTLYISKKLEWREKEQDDKKEQQYKELLGEIKGIREDLRKK